MNYDLDDAYTTYGSASVNGQFASVYERSAFSPGPGLAPQYRGRGANPPTIAQSNTVDDTSIASIGSGSGGTNQGEAALAAANPWDPTVSPNVWAIGFLVLGMLILRYVHWKG